MGINSLSHKHKMIYYLVIVTYVYILVKLCRIANPAALRDIEDFIF